MCVEYRFAKTNVIPFPSQSYNSELLSQPTINTIWLHSKEPTQYEANGSSDCNDYLLNSRHTKRFSPENEQKTQKKDVLALHNYLQACDKRQKKKEKET